MPRLRYFDLDAVSQPDGDGLRNIQEAPLSGMRDGILVCANGRDGCACGDFVGPDGDSEQWLVSDARAGGWLCDDGAGFRAYCKFHGILEPSYERRVLPSREVPFSVAFPGADADIDAAIGRRERVV